MATKIGLYIYMREWKKCAYVWVYLYVCGECVWGVCFVVESRNNPFLPKSSEIPNEIWLGFFFALLSVAFVQQMHLEMRTLQGKIETCCLCTIPTTVWWTNRIAASSIRSGRTHEARATWLRLDVFCSSWASHIWAQISHPSSISMNMLLQIGSRLSGLGTKVRTAVLHSLISMLQLPRKRVPYSCALFETEYDQKSYLASYWSLLLAYVRLWVIRESVRHVFSSTPRKKFEIDRKFAFFLL
jgi:hypothetical protein